ncbi:uncharacterized protein si:rp71-46j2.7 isoform X2 [Hoplias malabaricus]|uniref:uncharacterized protein si:rp71-46j2.7 isoform X2 n=1 Tax=Hoplias malabaricus TaxID=27720 RepID=UPI003461C4FE
MRFWHCLLATFLSLVWYFSESGQFPLQVAVCVVCFLLIVPAVCERREKSTQTESTEETFSETCDSDHVVGRDETDTGATVPRSQYPNVQRALNQLFRCAYNHLVQPWYTVPELVESQPLYTALLSEFQHIVDQIIEKAKDFDLSVTSVGCIHIFTQHLHCAKKSHKSPLFSCKAEEMAILRNFCDALIQSLFPQHLWASEIYHCALQEILAMKVLVLVTLLSDPDHLNRLVVCQLERMPTVSLVKEASDSEKEDFPSSLCLENREMMEEEVAESPSEEIRTKKKGSKMIEKVSKLFKKKGKMKKIKKKEKELMQKALSSRRPAVIESDGANSCESSINESEDSDMEYYFSMPQEERMEFKLSFEMWRVGKWDVTVTNVESKEEILWFTIHLEEINNPENLHWDVKKTQLEIVDFYNHCKGISHLPSIASIVENTKTNLNEDCQEEARSTFECFLKVLLADTELGHTQLVFKFLYPLHKLLGEEEQDEGVWFLLGGLASFLTPGQEDDEPHNLKGEEKPDDAEDGCSLSEATPQNDCMAPVQPECTDKLQRQCSKIEGELSVTHSGYPSSSEHNCKSEKQYTQCPYYIFNEDEPETLSGSESVGDNLAQFAARTKVLPKKQPASLSALDTDDESYYETDGFSDCHVSENVNKKEFFARKKSTGSDQLKGKEKDGRTKEETQSPPQIQAKKTGNPPKWRKPEVNKVIFDLLKEISGNSCFLKIIKTALIPFMPLIKKKVNEFLKKLNPSEAQIAGYTDQLRELLWPEGPVSQEPARTTEDKNETKEKALHLLSSRLSGYPIFSKADVENLFKILQDAEENKKLVYGRGGSGAYLELFGRKAPTYTPWRGASPSQSDTHSLTHSHLQALFELPIHLPICVF